MPTQLELPLFDFPSELSADSTPVAATTSNLKWSYSRRSTLEQCPKRYYYLHYAANSRLAKAEPSKEKIKFLKELSNRYLRIGEILHLVIRTYFKRLQQGEAFSPDRLLRWARDIYRRDLEYSQQKTSFVKSAHKPVNLLEFYYSYPEAQLLWEESEAQLLTAIENFVTSPILEPFRLGGGQQGALVEKKISIKDEYCSISGQVDLAYPDDPRRMVLVDWKIGNSNSGTDNLQLQIYVLWLVQQLQYTAAQIEPYQVHLADSHISPFTIQEKDLQRAKSRVIQDLERMQEIDRYGRNAISGAFTPCKQPRVCNLCPFQEICH